MSWLTESKKEIIQKQFEVFEFSNSLDRNKIKPITEMVHYKWAKANSDCSEEISFITPLKQKIKIKYIQEKPGQSDRYRKLFLYIDNLQVYVYNMDDQIDDEEPWLTIL